MSHAHINGTDLFYRSVGTGWPCFVLHGGLGLDHTYLHPWLDPLGDQPVGLSQTTDFVSLSIIFALRSENDRQKAKSIIQTL